jgi:HK97 family phage portal protein
MKWLPSIFSRKNTTPLSSPRLAELLASAFGGGAAKSGASVGTRSAMEVSVVLSCVRAIAEGVAQVPWRIMRESPDGRTRVPAKDHPLWMLFHRRPNRFQSSFEFRETLIFHILLGSRGCAYVFKSRIDNKVVELMLIDPDMVREQVVPTTGEIVYLVTGPSGQQRVVPSNDIWRIPGPSWTGTEALPLIRLAREAIGLAMATEETQAKLHANGVKASGMYSIEGSLNNEQYTQLKTWIEKEFSGSARAGTPFILDRSAKWQPFTISGVDAQHLETRRHQVEEVCRVFRVLPVMAMQQDKAATYASAEQMFIAHLVHTLMPWYERIEQSADVNLLTPEEMRSGYYSLLDGKSLLRGSMKDTSEFLSKMTERGVMTRNEGREMLDLNPIDGLDQPLTPMNMQIGTDPAPQE